VREQRPEPRQADRPLPDVLVTIATAAARRARVVEMEEAQAREPHRGLEAREQRVPGAVARQVPPRAPQVRRVEADAQPRRAPAGGDEGRELLEARAERRAGAVLEQEVGAA